MKPAVLLNNFKAQWKCVRGDALKAIDRVGQSGWFILGDEVAHFEEQLATYTGRRYAVGCASGLDAIELKLRILACEGKPVITTPLSAFATTLGIVRAGGIPIFVLEHRTGVGCSTWTRLSDSSEITRARIAYYFRSISFGHTLDLEHFEPLRNRYRLTVVEDCAQAIGKKTEMAGVQAR